MSAPLLANKGDTAPDFDEISRDQTADQSRDGGHSITELSERNVDTAIKTAFKSGDGGESKKLHTVKISKYASNDQTYEMGKETHKGEIGDFMKSIIFGGLDGIITLFAIVASISGSELPAEVVLVLGFSKLVGDGISMGMGDFLSEKAEIDFVKSELERETWEFENYPQGEVQEMVEIYKEKGIAKDDAETILNTMSKYPKLFVDHMMMQELELNPGQIEDNPKKNGCITFTSFLFFGTIPLLSYLIFYGSDIDKHWDWTFTIAIILTCSTMFGMGAVKGYYNNANFIKSGLFVMLNGSLAAGSAYFIGWGLAEALDADLGELH
eukprot:CAMPEP_0201569504 /NCGR_PEP_ID=MMETSP0190_2-20130828/11214_1 /ASSEMBLY_ACC=CAM_ASM_000263 /TAXON_ID=37353 /ORGANISM="Rosalina sp." /LENGTH=324 /DNA_ID=CAMNT_0047991879 /DNA_START=98 /DNA_END=1072 /DNA_ORIENTATION=-